MNISIQQPCNARLEGAFTADSFCLKCTKQIEDLSWLTPAELHAKFLAENGKLCGTIRVGQSFELPHHMSESEKMMLQPDFLKRSLITGMMLLSSFSFATPLTSPKLTFPSATYSTSKWQQPIAADSIHLEGKVLDQMTGQSVVMAKVVLKIDGQEWSTVTDLNGTYAFELSDTMVGKSAELFISAIDFMSDFQTITISKQQPLLESKLYAQEMMIEGIMIDVSDDPIEPPKEKKKKH